MLYLDNQAIDVIRHATEAFIQSFDGEPDAPYTPEAEQVLEDLKFQLMAEIEAASDDQTTPAKEFVDDLEWELRRFEFETSNLTYLVYTSDIQDFYIRNSDEVEEVIGEFGGVIELTYESNTIGDLISDGVALAQSTRAATASAYYAGKSDVLREWLENELVEQYGHGWDEDEDEDEN